MIFTRDKDGQIDVVDTNLIKAFDIINHGIMLQKVSHLELIFDFSIFFKPYFVSRKVCVQYKAFSSRYILVRSGVSHGFILGPLLFVSYINVIVCSPQSNFFCMRVI